MAQVSLNPVEIILSKGFKIKALGYESYQHNDNQLEQYNWQAKYSE